MNQFWNCRLTLRAALSGLSARRWPHTGRRASWMMPARVRGTGSVRLVYGVVHGLVLPVWRGNGI